MDAIRQLDSGHTLFLRSPRLEMVEFLINLRVGKDSAEILHHPA